MLRHHYTLMAIGILLALPSITSMITLEEQPLITQLTWLGFPIFFLRGFYLMVKHDSKPS